LKKIVILSTGGTISTKFSANAGGLVPALGAENLLNVALNRFLAASDIAIEARNVLMLNSSALTIDSLCEIKDSVRQCLEDDGIDGVVITHGTGMMEETGYFLDIALDVSKPVVMTGAQRDYSQPDSDGPRNLAEAIMVAAEPKTVGQGVVIVFNSEIFAARDVTKQHCLSVQAFSSGAHGYLGCIYPNEIIYYRKTIRPQEIGFQSLETNVDLIKFTIGADARFIDCSIAKKARGIVIEASGTGNVNTLFYEGIKRAIAQGILVGVTTKTPEGRAVGLYANPGGGAKLVEAGALLMGDLSGQKARLLLMAALGDGRSLEEAREICKRHAM